MAAAASSEQVSCYSETVAGDYDCRTSSYADEKDDYIDEFVTTRAEDTSTKCKRRKLRDILVSEKVSGVLTGSKQAFGHLPGYLHQFLMKLKAQQRLQSLQNKEYCPPHCENSEQI